MRGNKVRVPRTRRIPYLLSHLHIGTPRRRDTAHWARGEPCQRWFGGRIRCVLAFRLCLLFISSSIPARLSSLPVPALAQGAEQRNRPRGWHCCRRGRTVYPCAPSCRARGHPPRLRANPVLPYIPEVCALSSSTLPSPPRRTPSLRRTRPLSRYRTPDVLVPLPITPAFPVDLAME
ncbi:hypothetical protein B0H16DRAFT_1499922 [Mycena metata]|uniref:Uncharacterized protein n=1 Tax=Mycena metata TaxID=1033252 RepID=A0AAD7H736_9AGAR|nr:hypothetical protein B0H16DRAFT_1620901 [Mycena metata]KAJ7779813.1 hypothetical protein B0H16DRAFT_1499922 [Mycena metata]